MTSTKAPYGHGRLVMPTRKVVLNGSTSASFSASTIENSDTTSSTKKTPYLTHLSLWCHLGGSRNWYFFRPIFSPMTCSPSCSEPNGQAQPQNRPRPNTNTVMKMKIQKRNRNGSLRNSVHSHLKRMEWNQVSTCVTDGCASSPKPTQTTKMAQNGYLKPLTGHLFLRDDIAGERLAVGVDHGDGGEHQAKMISCHHLAFQILSQLGSGRCTSGRPPTMYWAGVQYSLSKEVKTLEPVLRSILLLRKLSFHG